MPTFLDSWPGVKVADAVDGRLVLITICMVIITNMMLYNDVVISAR